MVWSCNDLICKLFALAGRVRELVNIALLFNFLFCFCPSGEQLIGIWGRTGAFLSSKPNLLHSGRFCKDVCFSHLCAGVGWPSTPAFTFSSKHFSSFNHLEATPCLRGSNPWLRLTFVHQPPKLSFSLQKNLIVSTWCCILSLNSFLVFSFLFSSSGWCTLCSWVWHNGKVFMLLPP